MPARVTSPSTSRSTPTRATSIPTAATPLEGRVGLIAQLREARRRAREAGDMRAVARIAAELAAALGLLPAEAEVSVVEIAGDGCSLATMFPELAVMFGSGAAGEPEPQRRRARRVAPSKRGKGAS